MGKIRRFVSSLGLITAAATGFASNDSINYMPRFHGTLRGRFEQSTVENVRRFQVRNARVSVEGVITPHIDYFLQADVCDRGKMKMLDAWGRIRPVKWFDVQLGQFRMPFGLESFLAPHTYWFANISYMGGTMCNYRAVGGKLTYRWRTLTLDGGIFNPNTISDHDDWHRPMAYSVRAQWHVRNVLLSGGFMSIEPSTVRANLADVAMKWSAGRWMAAAEYMYEHYTGRAHKAAHSYVAQLNYAMPVDWWEFNRLSFQARFDGITAFTNPAGTADEGLLATTQQPVNRITAGTTIGHHRSKNLFADLRLNYEKMFFHSDYRPNASQGDKLTLELVLRF